MWRVNRPPFAADETFSTCIDRVKDRALKGRLEGIVGHISHEAASYAERAEASQLYLVPQTVGVAGRVTTEEMVKVYKRMTDKNGTGRHVYDALKLLPEMGICPFCDHRPVSTLDHLLPKQLFPSLAVTPDNLVGACADCNKAKLDFAPGCAEEVVLHPYFDDVENGRWLTARVEEGTVAALVFRTQKVAAWPDELNERIRRQFEMLGLAKLYGAQAAREISMLAYQLERTYVSRGSGGVHEELAWQAEAREAARFNSWQAVAYRSLSECDWYCDGGFRAM